MKTAVQLRTLAGDERPRAELLFGTPCDVGEGRLGPVARFESGEVVAYQVRSRQAPAPLRLPDARGRRRLGGRRAGRPPARSTPHGAAHGRTHPARAKPVRVPHSHGLGSIGAARRLLHARRRHAWRPATGSQDPALASVGVPPQAKASAGAQGRLTSNSRGRKEQSDAHRRRARRGWRPAPSKAQGCMNVPRAKTASTVVVRPSFGPAQARRACRGLAPSGGQVREAFELAKPPRRRARLAHRCVDREASLINAERSPWIAEDEAQ